MSRTGGQPRYRPRPGAIGVAVVLLAALAACTVLGACARRPSPVPRLVLLIIIDTLRADRLGCYGYAAIETPVLDRIAREGLLYESATTAVPLTLPSVATLLTGAYPLQHGIRDNGPFALAESWETLPERFRDAGYATAAFVSADVLSRDHGLTQGFDHYDDDLSASYEVYDPQLAPFRDSRQGLERRADATVDRVLAWAAERPGERLLLCVHLFDPHLPRDPVPELRERYPGRPYDGEIAFTDREIGRLQEGLRRHWRPSETLTLVVADHGEGLQDHEEEFHGYLLFEETMRVPLLLSGPGLPKGERRTEPVRTIDVAPTLCALAGLPPLPASRGLPLPGAVPAAPEERVAYLETFRPRWEQRWGELRGLRAGRWKLVRGPHDELYDLARDPGERRDLARLEPQRADSLARCMEAEALLALAAGSAPAEALTLSGAQQERLRSLGYLEAAHAPSPAAATPGPGGSPTHLDTLAIHLYPPAERGAALGLPHPRARLAAYNRRIQARSFEQAGRRALAAGDAPRAAAAFRQAIAADSSFADARLGLAYALDAAGDGEGVLRELRAAWRALPGEPEVAATLATAMENAGLAREARAVLAEARRRGLAVERSSPGSLRERAAQGIEERR